MALPRCIPLLASEGMFMGMAQAVRPERLMGVAELERLYALPLAGESLEQAWWHELQVPRTVVIPEMAEDIESRGRAERLYRSLGGIAVEAVASPEQAERPVTSLYDALRKMRETNDEAARQLVEANVRSDLVERSIKDSFAMTASLQTTDTGEIIQFGQTSEQIQKNTILYANSNPLLHDRTEAEVRNAFRMEQANQMGRLEDNYFVVLSRCPDTMTTEQMKRAGFFVETMSMAIQVTTRENGRLFTETVFVAGRSESGERHDKRGVGGIGELLGVSIGDMDDAELLDTPLLVPKARLQDGAIDLVRAYDQAAGDAFCGKRGVKGNYDTFRDDCRAREAEFEPMVQGITEELLAHLPEMRSPTDAVKMLAKLSQRNLVDRAIADRRIDARVFDYAAAAEIEAARQAYEAGRYDEAIAYRDKAQAKARSSSCPNGMAAASFGGGSDVGESGEGEQSENEDEYGSLEFKCPNGHTNHRPRHKLLEKCQKCGVSVRC